MPKASIKQKIIAAYETMADRYNELIDHKPHNAYYDRPNTLSLLPDVNGVKILDAACGPGKYAEILSDQGAIVTGIDISPKMIELAKNRNPDNPRFYLHDLAQPMSLFEDETYDVVLCALALHYIEDWGPTIREFCRVLRAGGILVISIEHPFFEYTYFKSQRYFEVENVRTTWRGFGQPVEVNSYRRPLQACINPLIQNGFALDKILEPLPTEEFARLDPKHYRELQEFPAFMCMRATKR